MHADGHAARGVVARTVTVGVRGVAVPRSARALALVAAIGAACSGVERPLDWHAPSPPPPPAWSAAGPFDAMDPAAVWGVGDRVVYTIAVTGGGIDCGYEFTLTTLALPPARRDDPGCAHPVHGRVLTRSARESWQHEPRPYYAGGGNATLRAELRGDDGSACGGDVDTIALAHWYADELGMAFDDGVQPLFATLVGLDCMQEALLRVVRAPSAWSVVRGLGAITLALEWPRIDRFEIAAEPTPFGPLPTAWRPFTITANDQPALHGRMQITWKHSPLALGAGVLQLEAWHPDDASRRVTIRLASARRGVPPDSPPRDDLGFGLRRDMTLEQASAMLGGASVGLRERGHFADGSTVETFDLANERTWLTVAVRGDRLLFAAVGEDLTRDWLRRQGFVRDPMR